MFTQFSKDWLPWTRAIADHVKYDTHIDALDVDMVITAMLELGFTVEPPNEKEGTTG